MKPGEVSKEIEKRLLRRSNLHSLYEMLTKYIAEGKIEPLVRLLEQHDNNGGTVMALVWCNFLGTERQMLLCKRSMNCLAIAFSEDKAPIYGIDGAGNSANVNADWIRKLLLKHYDKLQLITCPNQAVRELFEEKSNDGSASTA